MSAGAPAAAATPPPTADPQDPLPESNWVWRRVFVLALAGLSLVAIGIILFMLFGLGKATLDVIARLSAARDVKALEDAIGAIGKIIDGLVRLGIGVEGILFALLLAYLIAPSAEQAAKMLATVWAWKGGISTSSTARSTAPDGSSAEATTSAGPATGTPVPPTPAAPAIPATQVEPEPDIPNEEKPPYARDL
jgi:hypothetical protein